MDRVRGLEKATRGRVVLLIATACLGMTMGASAATQAPATASGSAPTFTVDVAPIIYARCASCHRSGEVAPMSLLTFKEVRPWTRAIRDKVVTRAMPPWHADRRYGRFRNEQSLDQSEIDTIVRWVDAGAPEGDPSRLPALPALPQGWQIGVPDVVLEMPVAYEIPATGTIDYQYFELPTNFAEDRWVQAGEVRAGDRAHVHHIIVYVQEAQPAPRPTVMSIRPILGATPPAAAARRLPSPPAGTPGRGSAAASRTGDQMLVNWAVGEDAPVFAPGVAKRLPKGASLVFQVHYTTNGTPGSDRSKIGLVFAKEPPPREIRTAMILNPLFAIPPGAADHQVEAEATFSEEVRVWSMHPHMHLRGKDMTYTAIYPDGRHEIVLRVPKFDFGWQTDYWLATPLHLPKGSKLHVSAHFDNRANPDPAATVRWGDQTWEEMMIGFFAYTVEGPAVPTSARR
jgi:hypothetical protein